MDSQDTRGSTAQRGKFQILSKLFMYHREFLFSALSQRLFCVSFVTGALFVRCFAGAFFSPFFHMSFFRAPFCGGFFCEIIRRRSQDPFFRWCFGVLFRALYPKGFFGVLSRSCLLLLCFAGASSARSFVIASSLCPSAGPFYVRFFTVAFPCVPSKGLSPCALLQGLFP